MSADQRAASRAHRVNLVLAIHVGQLACVCRSSGITGRGPLTYDATGHFVAGAASFQVLDVGSITIEPDLITIHLGAIA